MQTQYPCVCGIIPPQILRRLAEHADDEPSRRSARATLEQMDAMRAQRAGMLVTMPAVSAPGKRRRVFDAGHRETLPGKLVLNEGDPRAADVEVNEAYDGAGTTYNFFAEVFGRRSVDGKGLRLDSSVHYGDRFDNAMWNGEQMLYGDGDGKWFRRFTAAVDVIGHELTHGVTQFTAALQYDGQSGALNEHVSDVFGILLKQYKLRQTAAAADWLIGEGLFTARVHGKAVRSMAAPGTAYDDPVVGRDEQPAHMRDYYRGSDDNHGVHTNSGIPNHAFYLAAKAIGGYAWEAAGKIWYTVLTTKLAANAHFKAFATATVATAAQLYGAGGREHQAVREAWRAVGVAFAEAPARDPHDALHAMS